MKTIGAAVLVVGVMACVWPQAVQAGTKCTMKFDLHGWSAVYQSATGSGTITCDNKQSAKVTLRSKGGGLTVGKSKISNGRGTFTEVSSINELFGKYVAANTSAGAVEAATSQVMTKGEVSLAISGTGKGWDIGISFGEFVIQRRKK
jgi:hypothetical protein